MSAAFEIQWKALIGKGVLKEIEHEDLSKQILHNIGKKNLSGINICLLSCCDGHQFMDTTRHTFKCFEAAKAEAKKKMGFDTLGEDCFHWKTENGGPFVLSHPKLMVTEYKGQRDYVDRSNLRAIRDSLHLKEMNIIVLIGHALCGMMKPLVNSINDYTYYMAQAKKRVMEEFNLPSNQVIAQLQCHRFDGKRRTYHIDYSEAISLQKAA